MSSTRIRRHVSAPREAVYRALLDPNAPWLEIGLLVAYDRYDGQAPAAGVITGVGVIEGREAVVVANKPSGLLVHRGWAQDDDVAMFRVRDALGGAHVYPLRFGRVTLGVGGEMLVARSSRQPIDSASAQVVRLDQHVEGLDPRRHDVGRQRVGEQVRP